MCHHADYDVPCDIGSVPIARQRFAQQLRQWGLTSTDVAFEDAQAATLVLTELMSNAVRFCSVPIAVQFDTHHDRIELAVTDDSADPAVVRHPEPTSTGGRGMQLVEALSREWGQIFSGSHKTVWATVAIPAGSALQRNCRFTPDHPNPIP